MICCVGDKCIGPYNPTINTKDDVGDEQFDLADNNPDVLFTEYLFDTTNDPFDMHPLNINTFPMDIIRRLRSLLPLSFAGCGHDLQEANQAQKAY